MVNSGSEPEVVNQSIFYHKNILLKNRAFFEGYRSVFVNMKVLLPDKLFCVGLIYASWYYVECIQVE